MAPGHSHPDPPPSTGFAVSGGHHRFGTLSPAWDNFRRVGGVPEPPAVPFEGKRADISRQGAISVVPAPPGPPQRIDGYTIGAVPNLHGVSLHAGEVHPDGDEFLYCVSGSIELVLDDGDEHAIGTQTRVALHAGDASVVPKGVWHVLESKEPSYLVHVTPGPHGGHRPRPVSAS